MIAGADSAAAAKAKAKPAAPGAPVSDADQKQKDAAQARQSYETGIKSYSAGKYQPAVDELSGALRGGGLASAEMAKALYVRGMAYKKLSKPGLAISDLTSALWLKNGLGEADQKSAIAERGEAYRMAGLGDGNSGSDKVAVADPNPTPAGAKASAPVIAAPAAPAPAKAPASVPATAKAAAAIVPAAGPANVEITRQSPDSEAARDAANARRLASTPVETGGLQSVATASLIGDQQRNSPAAEASAAPPVIPAPVPAPASATPVLSAAPIEGASSSGSLAGSTGGMSAVTGFFSNMFGGSSNASAPAAGTAQVTTASTTSAPETSSWSETTSVANGAGKKSASAKAAQKVATQAQAAPAMPSGKYKIHIAAVRSRAEAEALAQKLAAQNGAALKSRTPVVDEAVIGSMGTFYRVRVGSYATAEEPRAVCNTLRASGFDCLVVTN